MTVVNNNQIKYPKKPTKLYIEPTNVCNADCIFCGYQYEGREKGMMTEELAEKSMLQYLQLGGEKNIAFNPVVGEPLLNKKVVEFFSTSRKLGFTKVMTFTNGTRLYKMNLVELLNSGINEVWISTAPFQEDIYKKIYRYKHYNKFLDGLVGLFKENQTLGNPVRIRINFRSNLGREKILKTDDYVNKIKMYIVDEEKDITVIKDNFDDWGGMIKKQDLLDGMDIKENNPIKKIPCARLWQLSVLWNGDVRACACRFTNKDPVDSLKIGNIHQENLNSLWYGEKHKNLIDSFFGDSLNVTCTNCAHYVPVTKYIERNTIDKKIKRFIKKIARSFLNLF